VSSRLTVRGGVQLRSADHCVPTQRIPRHALKRQCLLAVLLLLTHGISHNIILIDVI